ncbi:MAG: winged helix-turn-helix transcriptional regulator [Trueperaceae bacterium]|nr:winged helix-turn-helix transcriptional regulator [Trueperaceae bacterium]
MVNHSLPGAPRDLSGVFAALAHPTRRAIVAALARGEATAGELAAPFEVSLPAISRHLKALEKAALVTREVRGRTHVLRLDLRSLREVDDWLEPYRQAWETRLDRLDTYLEENP